MSLQYFFAQQYILLLPSTAVKQQQQFKLYATKSIKADLMP